MEELGHSSPHVYDYLIYDKGDCRVAIKDNVTVHIEKKKSWLLLQNVHKSYLKMDFGSKLEK